MAILYCYWHQVVNNEYLTLLLTSSGLEWNCTLLLTFSGQEWQFSSAMHIYMRQIDPISIEQRYLAYHYTLYINIYIYYIKRRWAPQSIKHRGLEYCYTYIDIYIYIGRRWTPWSIEHRGLAFCYTAYIYKGDELPWSIDHRGLAYHYTDYI